jgi:hypothetical protein
MTTVSSKLYLMLIIAASGVMSDVEAKTKTIKGILHFSAKPAYVGIFYANDNVAGKSPLEVDQVNKHFMKKVYVNDSVGNTVFKNSDATDHNIYTNSPHASAKFNVGLIAPGQQVTVDASNWNQDAVLRLGCKIHPRMKTFIANVKTSNYQVLELSKKIKNYRLILSDISFDTTKVTLWLPRYEPITINLEQLGSQSFELVKKGKKRGYLKISIEEDNG